MKKSKAKDRIFDSWNEVWKETSRQVDLHIRGQILNYIQDIILSQIELITRQTRDQLREGQ